MSLGLCSSFPPAAPRLGPMGCSVLVRRPARVPSYPPWSPSLPSPVPVRIMVGPFVAVVPVLGVVFMGRPQRPPLVVPVPAAAIGGAVAIAIVVAVVVVVVSRLN